MGASPPGDLEGRILLSGLRVMGRHGVLPEEKERAQPFEVDLEIETDLAEAARSDDLAAALDYGKVATAVAGVVSGESFDLLEALAEAISRAVLADDRAGAVTVTVRKLRPPVPLDLASAAVSLRRSRS